MDWNIVCFSVDVEWAHPVVLAHLVRLFDERGVPATFFCTHPAISVPGHERALHPNFRRNGDSMRLFSKARGATAETVDEPAIYEHIIKITREFCPEAIGSRSHSLFYDAQLLPILARNRLEYDSTYFLPGAKGLRPMIKEHAILELPIYYMDHHDLNYGMTDFRVENLGLDRPGLKVLDFHPNLVFINAANEEHYQRTKAFYHDCDRLADARHAGRGVATFLKEVLDYVADRRLPTATLSRINREWRASGEAAALRCRNHDP